MINQISQNGRKAYGVADFVVDEKEELKQIPNDCGMGSTVLVISEKKVYVKNGAGKWVDL